MDGSSGIFIGLASVILGLMCFLEGLKVGLMPFGEAIGHLLPRKSSLPVVLVIALLLGVGVTLAEPAMGALKVAGRIVDVERAPLLHLLLNNYSDMVVLVVGIGVGIAAMLGVLRFIYGWSLKPLIYIAVAPILGLTLYAANVPALEKIIGLAWDSGAVTTGPVTVPLVLSLGIGIAAAAGRGDNALSGFGIVTLASLFPILGVLVLGTVVYLTDPAIVAAAQAPSMLPVTASLWYEHSPASELFLSLRAILPLVIFLYLVFRVVLHGRLKQRGTIAYGIGLSVLGMLLFNLGLTYGLTTLGNQTGNIMPAAFVEVDSVDGSPLYLFVAGLLLVFAFAWAMGFGATMAEPALNALGNTVQNLTNGLFKKETLLYTVSAGVGFGIMLGLSKVVFDIPLVYLLLPLYVLALVLTFFSTEEYVNIAWDSAGVTTGPITVPLVLALGLGLGDALQAVEGFGILAMASICPILSVLAVGIWVRAANCRSRQKAPCDFWIPASETVN